ncbi:hypothetical protein QBC44DRAFT_369115 [Cladorrhinum sp. PSN332]|nr:hypothetical protein QBC44DRAFT_369115 [Cladorrhinum sp. PSN332]
MGKNNKHRQGNRGQRGGRSGGLAKGDPSSASHSTTTPVKPTTVAPKTPAPKFGASTTPSTAIKGAESSLGSVRSSAAPDEFSQFPLFRGTPSGGVEKKRKDFASPVPQVTPKRVKNSGVVDTTPVATRAGSSGLSILTRSAATPGSHLKHRAPSTTPKALVPMSPLVETNVGSAPAQEKSLVDRPASGYSARQLAQRDWVSGLESEHVMIVRQFIATLWGESHDAELFGLAQKLVVSDDIGTVEQAMLLLPLGNFWDIRTKVSAALSKSPVASSSESDDESSEEDSPPPSRKSRSALRSGKDERIQGDQMEVDSQPVDYVIELLSDEDFEEQDDPNDSSYHELVPVSGSQVSQVTESDAPLVSPTESSFLDGVPNAAQFPCWECTRLAFTTRHSGEFCVAIARDTNRCARCSDGHSCHQVPEGPMREAAIAMITAERNAFRELITNSQVSQSSQKAVEDARDQIVQLGMNTRDRTSSRSYSASWSVPKARSLQIKTRASQQDYGFNDTVLQSGQNALVPANYLGLTLGDVFRRPGTEAARIIALALRANGDPGFARQFVSFMAMDAHQIFGELLANVESVFGERGN